MGSEPRLAFGFDCSDGPACTVQGFENVPVDWYAVPRFDEYELPDEGSYKWRIDGQWGQIRKDAASDDAERPIQVRIFDNPLAKSKQDIKRQVDEVMQLPRHGRSIPCLCGSVLPETSLDNYRCYADCLRQQIMKSQMVTLTDGEMSH